jgi:hypothetical protein
MKKISSLIALVLFVIVVRSQPPKPPSVEERLKHTNEVLQQDVKPNAAQQAAIDAAFKNFFLAADQLRKDNPPPPPPPPDPKVKAAMDKLVKERDESIKKILTEDQYKKYKEAAKKLQPPKPGDHKEPPPPTSKN